MLARTEMKQTPTRSRKACNVFWPTLLGVVLSHYGLAWSLYGMGYTSHACNYVGYAIVILSPFVAIFAIAFIASGRVKVGSEWKNSIIYGFCAFLTGPVLYCFMQAALYSTDPTLCAFLPPLGWG